MAKTRVIEAPTKEAALQRLSEQLRIEASNLRYVESQSRKHTFEILRCAALVDVETSQDGMKTVLKRLVPPIGEGYPTFNMQFVLEELKSRGVVFGLKRDVLTQELMKALRAPADIPLTIVIAEGAPAINGSVSRAKYTFDTKVFEKPDPVYVKAGEVLAIAPESVPPKDGSKVSGEVIVATLEESQKLQIGAGIKARRVNNELHFVAESSGRLHFDQGIRLRVDSKVINADEGMSVAVEVARSSLFNKAFEAKDLIEWAKTQNVVFGLLDASAIDQQLKSQKKWPARILVAKGQQPVDGKAGKVVDSLRAEASKTIDQEKAKAGYVFPGEIFLTLEAPTEPINGQTPFGEVLRAKPYTDMAVYPGKNVVKAKQGDLVHFKSQIYGIVKREGDRIHVESPLKISSDKMKVTMIVYPQRKLSLNEIAPLLRESDILVTPDKEQLDQRLEDVFSKAVVVSDFLVAEGKPPMPGRDAKLVYRFDPNLFKDKGGLFAKKAEVSLLAVRGDLLLTKMEPVDAQQGYNVFREKIPVPASGVPKDIKIRVGKGIDEKILGREDDPQDLPRTEFRAGRYGVLAWNNFSIDIIPAVTVDKEESLAMILLAPASDFGTRLSLEILKQTAEDEAIRVEIAEKVLEAALKQPRAPDRSLKRVVFAQAIPVQHGTSSEIQYLVEFNNQKIEKHLASKIDVRNIEAADFVRPGEVLALKVPAKVGVDGKTIFGRRIPADLGRDEPWFFGEGVSKSADGLQLVAATKGPGYVFVESGKLVVRSTVRVAPDKMSASITLYSSNNPQFQLREDKVLGMLGAAGVKYGIKVQLIRETVQAVLASQEAVEDLTVAEGLAPQVGGDASYVFAVDIGQTVGELRDDGSVDFKNRHVFQNISKGTVVLIRRPPMPGEEGRNVLGEAVPAKPGADMRIEAGEGIEIVSNGVEYRAKIDGIVEYRNRKVRVFPGLLLGDDVGFKTGHINAGPSNVFIKGGVLPDFVVKSEGRISIEKAAEACTVEGQQEVIIKGGIIGRDRGRVFAGKSLDTMYISGGATVECPGDIKVGAEIMNSVIRSAGFIECLDGAGTICGGEIWAFKGIRCRVLGALGSESQTQVHLGEHYFAITDARHKIAEAKIEEQIADIHKRIEELQKDLSLILSEREETKMQGHDLQSRFQKSREEKQQLERKLIELEEQKASIWSLVPWNQEALLVVSEVIHPGVTLQFKETTWTLKGELRGVEIYWDTRTSNIVSRKIGSKGP